MKLRVIIVDDHVVFREGLRSLLLLGPDIEVVAEAEDGSSALRLTEELLPDIVLMDLTMPGMNGIEATRQIVSNNGKVRVLVLSMESDRSFVVAALKAGASGYLLKESAFAEVTAAIRGNRICAPRLPISSSRNTCNGTPMRRLRLAEG